MNSLGINLYAALPPHTTKPRSNTERGFFLARKR